MNVYYTEQVIVYGADIANTPVGNVPVVVGATTYYQHNINYHIPEVAPSGNYEVIYQNLNTNSNTSIPVSILPYVATTTVTTTAVPVAANTENAQSTIKLGASSAVPSSV